MHLLGFKSLSTYDAVYFYDFYGLKTNEIVSYLGKCGRWGYLFLAGVTEWTCQTKQHGGKNLTPSDVVYAKYPM